jgi:hypothetical protein
MRHHTIQPIAALGVAEHAFDCLAFTCFLTLDALLELI